MSRLRSKSDATIRDGLRLDPGESPKKRAAWRQRLVEAEKGLTLGLRGDSTLFVHFFLSSVTVAAALVLGVSWIEWSVIVLALTLVLAAEMFNRVLAVIWNEIGHHLGEESRHAPKIGTAAVFVAIVGSVVAIALILAPYIVRVAEK